MDDLVLLLKGLEIVVNHDERLLKVEDVKHVQSFHSGIIGEAKTCLRSRVNLS